MKKVLVLSLVLVMAFASSAMAAVNFSGSFTATAKQEHFKVFKEGYQLKVDPEFKIGIKADNKTTVTEAVEVELPVFDENGEETGETVTEIQAVETEVTNWELTSELNLDSTTFKLGKYQLSLYDEWFTGYVWGEAQELTDKATYFGMITAAKKADDIRARLIVHVMDYADVTFDFQPADNMRVFAEGDVAGFDLGLAYARKNWTTDASNTIVAQAGYDVPAGDVDVRLEAAVGVNLADKLGLGFGLSADSDVTEQLNVNASVTYANKEWDGDGKAVVAENTILKAGAAYTEDLFKVSGDFSYTIKPEGTDNTNTIELTGIYRDSSVAYADLFKSDKWYTNDGLVVKAFAELTDVKLGKVGVEAVYPVIEDMIWAKAYANYGARKIDNHDKQLMDGTLPVWKLKSGLTASEEEKKLGGTTVPGRAAERAADDKFGKAGEKVAVWEVIEKNDFEAGADLYIVATDKLTVKPYAYYKNLGKVITLGSKADYKIGLSDTVLGFEVKKIMAGAEQKFEEMSLIQATVKVPF